ncbi:hypothetical protein Agub_g5905 [Astrephomene gubernaculifera]|uniref:Uncharacterized protein n=1 Tax=Astrephomene gubernaculifera TaxID=47775 RepID=A0AAD3DQ20_9CHLO|nr:hypothetical protein Agub_g5905 [Astrephomene gubernaculifera]
MSGNPDDKPSSLAESIESFKIVAEQGLADAANAADALLKQTASQLVAGGSVVVGTVQEAADVTLQYAEEGKVYVDHGLAELKAVEDVVVSHLKQGIYLIQSNPDVSYPLLATGSILALPVTRRLLYRATIGRFRNPDNVLSTSEGKVEALRVKMSDFETEAKKLQERMVAAEEEYVRGKAKLKATRQELQRLAAVVGKSERTAAGVLEDLRTLKKVDKAVQLRAEAASQVSALKTQRTALQQYIYRIASKDV